MISGSRPGGQPLNLQGVWNDKRMPPWNSGYTLNINLEMNYWPAEVTNLSECHEPLFRFIREIAASGAKVARDMYGLDGLGHPSQRFAVAGGVSQRRIRLLVLLEHVRSVALRPYLGALPFYARRGVPAGALSADGRCRLASARDGSPRTARGT